MNTKFGSDRLSHQTRVVEGDEGSNSNLLSAELLGTFRHAELFHKFEIMQKFPSIKRPRQLLQAITGMLTYHQMYWLEERSRAGYPFGDSVASLWLMRLLQVSIEAVVVDGRSGHVVGSTMRDSVISIDNVFATR